MLSLKRGAGTADRQQSFRRYGHVVLIVTPSRWRGFPIALSYGIPQLVHARPGFGSERQRVQQSHPLLTGVIPAVQFRQDTGGQSLAPIFGQCLEEGRCSLPARLSLGGG